MQTEFGQVKSWLNKNMWLKRKCINEVGMVTLSYYALVARDNLRTLIQN